MVYTVTSQNAFEAALKLGAGRYLAYLAAGSIAPSSLSAGDLYKYSFFISPQARFV